MWMLGFLCFILLWYSNALVAAKNRPNKWRTLRGNAPLVIARGGFSGVFPDSSFSAYLVAKQTGLQNLHVWCDVQLTKDGRGICVPDIKLENASNIDDVYPKGQNTYLVNNVSTQGWFTVDFTLEDLRNVNLKQRIFTRTPAFDDSLNQILTVEYMVKKIKPPALWLSVPHDAFFSQHNLSMRSFIISTSRKLFPHYISSPEVEFLRSVASRFRRDATKLVFQFLATDDIEPSTNRTYGSLLENLTFIKTFATGILVPKHYILPVDNSLYLLDSTTVVREAHAAGLEVFAYNFANDATKLPYNYSYDSVAEYLDFIDNGEFAVDGVISDSPVTASGAVDCYAHMSKNDPATANLLVISNEGASGFYPGCTDKAYEKAVSDGAEILDCPVQMTNDGIPFCLGSINLWDRTNVGQTDLSNRAVDNPDLGMKNGIFAYNLTWSEIQTLKPAIFNPYSRYMLFRNPKAKNDGKFLQLSDFLAFANASSVNGVMIRIENAAYLAEKQGLGVTDAVLDNLIKASFHHQKVMIRSSDSAVMSKFKLCRNCEFVYHVDEDVCDILNSTILEIKKFASSVIVSKKSVFPVNHAFLTTPTDVFPNLRAFNLSVYVELFRNEFVYQPWDFFSDPHLEINQHYSVMGINGVITDYPATAARYKRNRCLRYKTTPLSMSSVPPNGLISLISKQRLPPAAAPYPILMDEGVIEPPLPPIRFPTTNTENGSIGLVPSNTILSCIACLLGVVVLW